MAVNRIERIDLADADIVLIHAPAFAADTGVMARLLAETPWRQEDVHVWGKWHRQPRLTAWIGDPGASYTYSGRTMRPEPWTPMLCAMRDEIGRLADATFNSVLLNLYRDGQDRMGLHSDDEPSLGPEPVIASLSFGATRMLKLRHRHRADLGTIRIPLAHGSVLVMRGRTQACWRHGVDREARVREPRINLTFRQIVGG